MSIKRVQPAKAAKKKPTSTITESMPTWLALLLAKYGQAPGPLAGLAPQDASTSPNTSAANGNHDHGDDHEDNESEETDELVEEKPVFHEDVPDWLDNALKQPMPELASPQSTSTAEPSRNVEAPDWLNEALEAMHSAVQTVVEKDVEAESATTVETESHGHEVDTETHSVDHPESRKVIKLSELPRQPDPSTQGFGDWLSTLSKAKQEKMAAEANQELTPEHGSEPPTKAQSRGDVPDWLADMSPLTADTSLPDTSETAKPPATKPPKKKKPIKKKSSPKSLKDRLAKGSN